MDSTQYLTTYTCTGDSIYTIPAIDPEYIQNGNLESSEIEMIQHNVVKSKEEIFEKIKNNVSMFGEVQIRSQNAFNSLVSVDPDFHKLAHTRVCAQANYERVRIVQEIERLRPKMRSETKTVESGEYGFKDQTNYYNEVTGNHIGTLKTDSGSRGIRSQPYIESSGGGNERQEYETALQAELMKASNLKVKPKTGWFC